LGLGEQQTLSLAACTNRDKQDEVGILKKNLSCIIKIIFTQASVLNVQISPLTNQERTSITMSHGQRQSTVMKTIILESSEGKTFELFLHETRPSKLIRDAIEDDDDADEDEDQQPSIPLANVSSDTLEQVIIFLKNYAIEPMIQLEQQLGSSFHENVSQEFYRKFILDKSSGMVFKLANAANYLDIPPLLDLTCLKVSFDLMDKSAEEIRVLLKLPKLTKEEEEIARKDHTWMFEE
jgi:S-phase kinase-associated protein 1